MDYQPLNLATTIGRLRFISEEEAEVVDFREIVVLEAVPNDIGVVQGIITQEFQTPLSHVNVLSQNRGTPNMGLRGAWENETLRALEGEWVELSVTSSSWTIRSVTQEEADTWWEANRPEPIEVDMMDTSVQQLTDIEDILDLENLTLEEAIGAGVPAFGQGHPLPVARSTRSRTRRRSRCPCASSISTCSRTGSAPTSRRSSRTPTSDPTSSAVAKRSRRCVGASAWGRGPRVRRPAAHRAGDGLPEHAHALPLQPNAERLDLQRRGALPSGGDPRDPKPVLDAVRTVWASVHGDREFADGNAGITRNIGTASSSAPFGEGANGVRTANVFDPNQIDASFCVNVRIGR